MPEFDLEPLLSPLAGDAPCGADLEYDPAFLAMQEASAGREEQQYGGTVIPAQEPDWPMVREQALALAQRTRDLRLAVWLARSGARLRGFAGAVEGLQLAQGLLERHWEHVHPQLDANDSNDPTARLNALQPLVHANAGLADLRAAGLGAARGSLTVRDIELALGRAEPLAGESMPSEDGVTQAVAAAIAKAPELRGLMQAGHDAVQGIVDAIERHVGAAQGPDFAPLRKLLQHVAEAGRRAQGDAAAAGAPGAAVPAAAGAVAAVGNITSREDAVRTLQRVCEWIEKNEPSNPAPLLIRRAQRLMSKNFIDIIRDLMPDGLDQVEKLAGIGNE